MHVQFLNTFPTTIQFTFSIQTFYSTIQLQHFIIYSTMDYNYTIQFPFKQILQYFTPPYINQFTFPFKQYNTSIQKFHFNHVQIHPNSNHKPFTKITTISIHHLSFITNSFHLEQNSKQFHAPPIIRKHNTSI